MKMKTFEDLTYTIFISTYGTSWFDLLCLTPFSSIFQLYYGDPFLSGGRSRRESPTVGKQLANFITCGCESSAPFL
jgi:hypothetical protein